jgi:hypothetical protein
MRALSLKELDGLEPSSLQIENPESDPMFEARLVWLLDNQPQRVAKLFRESPGKLKAELVSNLQLASLELQRLRLKGEARDLAEEKVFGRIVAPADGPALSSNPPKPLPDEEREKILSGLLS